jgi:hypothetical protein
MGFGFGSRQNVYPHYLGFISPSMESNYRQPKETTEEKRRLGTRFWIFLLQIAMLS